MPNLMCDRLDRAWAVREKLCRDCQWVDCPLHPSRKQKGG